MRKKTSKETDHKEILKDLSHWEVRILDSLDTFVLASSTGGELCEELAMEAYQAAGAAMDEFLGKLKGPKDA